MLALSACATRPPHNQDNLCSIFEQKRAWHKAAVVMNKRWSVPIALPMAIVYQESSFAAKAKPARTYTFFGLIPWGYKSSAYGYSQALDATWNRYKQETNNRGADRDDFADAIDFVGWYVSQSRKINKVKASDAYRQYLNYHEGWTGFAKGSYKNKKTLKKIAKKVAYRARKYTIQYAACKEELSHGFWYRIFH